MGEFIVHNNPKMKTISMSTLKEENNLYSQNIK